MTGFSPLRLAFQGKRGVTPPPAVLWRRQQHAREGWHWGRITFITEKNAQKALDPNAFYAFAPTSGATRVRGNLDRLLGSINTADDTAPEKTKNLDSHLRQQKV